MKQRSFSGEIKQELVEQVNNSRHCRIAELSGLLDFMSIHYVKSGEENQLIISTENIFAGKKCFTLIRKTFNMVADISENPGTSILITIPSYEDSIKILQAVKLGTVNHSITTKSCCKRAYLRGAFIVAGSISDPNKFYHFEIVCSSMDQAQRLQEITESFDLDGKIVGRKAHYILYIKDGSKIAELLNIMEAHVGMMKFENIRIINEMRGSINRRVNCETANLNKTVSASVRQIEDIQLIQSTKGLSSLSESCEATALLRLENPDASLKELGEMMTPPMGKSGVNHKLRKISEIADTIRTASFKED